MAASIRLLICLKGRIERKFCCCLCEHGRTLTADSLNFITFAIWGKLICMEMHKGKILCHVILDFFFSLF